MYSMCNSSARGSCDLGMHGGLLHVATAIWDAGMAVEGASSPALVETHHCQANKKQQVIRTAIERAQENSRSSARIRFRWEVVLNNTSWFVGWG